MDNTEKKYGHIRNQLVAWFLVLGLFPLITVSAGSYMAARKGLTESAGEELKHTSYEKSRFIKNWFDYRWMDLEKQSAQIDNVNLLLNLSSGLGSSRLSTKQYVDSYDWASKVSGYQKGLVDTWLDYDYIYDLFLIDINGNILYTVVREDDLGTNLYTGLYADTLFAKSVAHTLETGEVRFSDYEYYGPSNDLLSAFLTAPLLNEAGEIAGVFATQIRLDRINELLTHDIKDNLVHYLVGKDGLLRSSISQDAEILRRKIQSTAFNQWQVEDIEAEQGTGEYSVSQTMNYINPNGKKVIGIYQTIKIKNVTWSLISEVDKRKAFATVDWIAQVEMLLCLVTGALIVLFSVKISRRISQPISQLVEVSEKLIKGDFNQTVTLSSKNEIGKLADVFNRMMSARKRYEKALRIQVEENKIVLDQLEEQRYALAHHAILAITDIEGNITYVNSKFEEISGYDQSELIGKNHRLLKSGMHGKDFFRDMYLTISSGEIWTGEICNRAKDGHTYWVYTTIAPFKDSKGKIDRYIAIRTDITQQKQAQSELTKAKDAAEMAAHAKSEFLASMSHEIRTPMNGVLGMLGLLMRGKLNPDQKHQARLALTSAESLLVLINDILDFSKIEAGKLEIEQLDFDLTTMLGDFSEAMAQKAQAKGVEFMLDVSGIDKTMVRGDPGRIRQILANLVSNSVKFTLEGEIVIKVDLHFNDQDQLRLQCSVSDTGIGIDATKINHIFESFTQVDASTTRKFGGTGLGLAIARKLCVKMGGDIAVSSEIGKGSCFTFEIDIEPSEKSKLLVPNVDISGLPILIVDDNATNLEVLKRQLQIWGAKVVEARHGEDALLILKNRKEDPTSAMFKVAFLDYQMPEMNGAQLGARIRANCDYNDMKMIMMTSISNRGDGAMFAKIGFDGYFPKPATTSDLFDALAVLVAGGEVLENAEPLVTHHYLKSLVHSDEGQKVQWPDNVRILLVEDNFINQTVAMGILDELGLSCETAANGIEAIEMLKNAEPKFPYTLLIMDCQMPEMDGYETTQCIRRGESGEYYASVPIIAMTANAMKGDMEKCIAVGMNDYMSKPVSYDEMKKKLTTWLKEINEIEVTTQKTTEINGVDKEVVWDKEDLLKRVRGKPDRALMLIDLFLKDVPDTLEVINNSVVGKDTAEIEKRAHSLKGVSGNLGAKRLMSLCANLEKAAKNSDLVAVELLASTLKMHCNDLAEALNNYRKAQ